MTWKRFSQYWSYKRDGKILLAKASDGKLWCFFVVRQKICSTNNRVVRVLRLYDALWTPRKWLVMKLGCILSGVSFSHAVAFIIQDGCFYSNSVCLCLCWIVFIMLSPYTIPTIETSAHLQQLQMNMNTVGALWWPCTRWYSPYNLALLLWHLKNDDHIASEQPHLIVHWGRMTHICVSKLAIISTDNGLSPGWRQAIIWTDAGILSIWPLGINFNDILVEIKTISFKKMRLKVSSVKWRSSCADPHVLTI